ncbi:MAG: MerR family transcriptional regulator [Anaerolineales bacterium]|nr:MAG: MerR family transcriptional regulator [Anaerolineales bacterium]
MRRDNADPVYIISIAARLVEAHPQTLRLYERLGLLRPARTENNIRLYSDEDIARLQQIQRLTNVGLNLAGVEMVLDLVARMENMRREFEEEMARREEEMAGEIQRLRQRAAAASE